MSPILLRLAISPLVCRVAAAAPAVMEPGRQWLPLEAIAAAALPAPVRRVLENLRREEGSLPRDGI